MSVKAREVFSIVSPIHSRRPCESRDPYSAAVMRSWVRVTFDCGWHWRLKCRTVVMGPCFRRDDGSSRHRKAQRLAAARHVDGGKAGYRKAAGSAVALFVDLELALAGAKLFAAAPIQWLVLELQRAVLGVHGFGKTENL